MTSIAAIVCGHTLDRWRDIQQAIASLHEQSHKPDEIIFVVDNNVELFQAAQGEFGEHSTILHNTGVRGVSPTRNVAAAASSCDVLAFLDDDAVADPQWVERLVSWYDDPEVAGVGGTANPAWDGGDGPRWFPPSFAWVVGCSHSGIAAEPEQVRNFIGCNMSIRRTAWHAVGGFYDGLGRVGADGGGGDETDFCLRVTQTGGGKIMNDPQAIVSHRVPADRQNLAYFVKRCRSEGRSKAQIAARAGTDAGLSAERNHLLTELPRAFLAGLGDALTGDISGLGRSAAIVVGTAATAMGFVAGTMGAANDASMDFVPIEVLVIDLDAPAPHHDPVAGQPLFVVVRRGHHLLGTRRFEHKMSGPDLVAHLAADFTQDHPRGETYQVDDTTATVVIATRDRTESLRRCLASIERLRRLPDRVIVVDNAPSGSETLELVKNSANEFEFPIEYVRCDVPGLGHAHNAALPHVTSEIVAFTDDDVITDPHWLDMAITGFAEDPRVVCVTGSILPAELETWPQDWVESSSNFTKGFQTKLFTLDGPQTDPLFPFTAGSMGSGANMAFLTSWLTDHGGFHGALGAGTPALGGDDLRIFYDVIDAGAALAFTPHAAVFHHHHSTPESIARQAHGYGAGLGAYLTSVVVDDPAALGRMLRRAPRALRHAAKVTSAGTPGYPGDRRRSWQQRAGLATGPLRYVRSRFA